MIKETLRINKTNNFNRYGYIQNFSYILIIFVHILKIDDFFLYSFLNL